MSDLSVYIQSLTTLVGYWPLDEVAGTAAVEAGGTLGNGVITGTAGTAHTLNQVGPPNTPPGKGILFNNAADGGQMKGCISLGADILAPALTTKTNIVVGFWYYLPADFIMTSGTRYFILAWNGNNAGSFEPFITIQQAVGVGGGAAFSASIQSQPGDPANYCTYNNALAAVKEKWHFVLVHADFANDKQYLYHDGVLQHDLTKAYGGSVFTRNANIAPALSDAFGSNTDGTANWSGSIEKTRLAHCFILHSAANVATIAKKVYDHGFVRMGQQKLMRPTKGNFSIQHLGL